jgi:hypothetical protein
VRWVRDTSGRFSRRPHYERDELEAVCGELLVQLRSLRPASDRPGVSTDDLTVLVESRASEVDLYASDLPAAIDGVTEFVVGARPRVRIAQTLSTQKRFATRLRTTLAHELAHVVLHDFLVWLDVPSPQQRCGKQPSTEATDWMEWQANYFAGALLVPRAQVNLEFGSAAGEWTRSSRGRALVRRAQDVFDVSAPAASVRLQQLAYLSPRPTVVRRAPLPRW